MCREEHPIDFPPEHGERPRRRHGYSDIDYYNGCSAPGWAISALHQYQCSENANTEYAWKASIHCGRQNQYDYTNIAKVWDKTVEEVENITGDLDTISCVSAATMHMTHIWPCDNWKTTADLIKTHSVNRDLRLSDNDILAQAEDHVGDNVENFDAARDCGPYTPKPIPGPDDCNCKE